MKLRYLYLTAVVALCLFMTACSKEAQQLTLTQFEGEVLISDGKRQVTGEFFLESSDGMSFEILSPQELSGITVAYTDGEMSLTYGGMELDYNSMVSQGDLFSDLFRVAAALSSSPHEVVFQDDKGYITLIDGENEYIVSLDGNLPEKIVSERNGISYSFSYS